jgi:hypothetical protein
MLVAIEVAVPFVVGGPRGIAAPDPYLAPWPGSPDLAARLSLSEGRVSDALAEGPYPDVVGEILWASRLRWRIRGATLWPAFAAAVVADALLLQLLPIQGDDGPGVVAAVLLAGFVNLFVVAVGAPIVGGFVRRRRPSAPRVVADDRAGTVLLGAVTLALLALGLAHAPSVGADHRKLAAGREAARRFILARAPLEFRANVERLDPWKQGPDLYRICAPGAFTTVRAFCVIVKTDRSPPSVVADPDRRPNVMVRGGG